MYISNGEPRIEITDPFSIEIISMGNDTASQNLNVSVYKPTDTNNQIKLSFTGYESQNSYVTTVRVEMIINDGTSGNSYGGK